MSESLGEMVVAITGNTDDFNLSIDQAGKKFDSLTTIISQSTSDMARSFKNIDNEAKLWGESTDLIKQKQQALKNEMTSLMQQGFDPLSPKVQSLKTQYSALENETKALGKEHVTLKSSMQEIDGMMGGFGSKIGALLTNPYVLAAAAIIGIFNLYRRDCAMAGPNNVSGILSHVPGFSAVRSSDRDSALDLKRIFGYYLHIRIIGSGYSYLNIFT